MYFFAVFSMPEYTEFDFTSVMLCIKFTVFFMSFEPSPDKWKNTQMKIKYNNATNKMKAVQWHNEVGRMRVASFVNDNDNKLQQQQHRGSVN